MARSITRFRHAPMRPTRNKQGLVPRRGNLWSAVGWAVSLVVATALLAACGASASSSALKIIYSPPKGGGQVGRLADVAILRTGVLLAVWSGGPGAITENRGIGICMAAISLDDGRSWSNPFRIYSASGLDVRGTGVNQLDDGRVAVTVDVTQPGGQHVQYPGSTRVLYLPASDAADRTGRAVESTANWKGPVVLETKITNQSSFQDGYDNSINPITNAGSGTLVEPFQLSEPFKIVAVHTGRTTLLETDRDTGYLVGTSILIEGVRGTKGLNGRWNVLALKGNFITITADTAGQSAGHGGTMVGDEVTSGICGVLVSHDDGKSWKWNQITQSPDQFLVEPAFTVVGSTWLFAVRNQTTRQVWVYRSTNGGQQWSMISTLSQVYGGPRLTTLPDGTVVVFARLSANDGIGALLWSTTRGASWSAPLQLNDKQRSVWFDYGGIAQVAPGRLVVVFSEFSRLDEPGCGKIVTGTITESTMKDRRPTVLRTTLGLAGLRGNVTTLAC